VSKIYNKKYAFYFKKVKRTKKTLKSKFKELSFSPTIDGEKEMPMKIEQKRLKE
jgi:hypothetical protein